VIRVSGPAPQGAGLERVSIGEVWGISFTIDIVLAHLGSQPR
jgi:hypothetical protein